MAITWSIVQLDYAISLDGETDVVNNSPRRVVAPLGQLNLTHKQKENDNGKK